ADPPARHARRGRDAAACHRSAQRLRAEDAGRAQEAGDRATARPGRHLTDRVADSLAPLAPVTLDGRYITLEPLAERHARDIFDVMAGGEVCRYLSWPPPRALDETLALIRQAEGAQDRRPQRPLAGGDRAARRGARARCAST